MDLYLTILKHVFFVMGLVSFSGYVFYFVIKLLKEFQRKPDRAIIHMYLLWLMPVIFIALIIFAICGFVFGRTVLFEGFVTIGALTLIVYVVFSRKMYSLKLKNKTS